MRKKILAAAISALAISALIIISLISVFQAGTASAVDEPTDNLKPLSGYGVAISVALNYSDGGWAGWSVPPSKVVTGGGFTLTGGPAAASAPGMPGESYPHYTYGPDEYGWVVQDAPDGAGSPGSHVYAIYADMPDGYGIAISPPMVFSSGGWGGWSVPEGKVVLGGGFIADGPVVVSAPGLPNTTYPHYTYGDNEYGWVVRNAGAQNTITIYAIYADKPAGYEVVTSPTLSYSDTGWGGWSVPAGKAVLGGGFHGTFPVAASAPGTPGSVWSHYTYGPEEYGWCVRDAPDGAGQPIIIYAICAFRNVVNVTQKMSYDTIQSAIDAALPGDTVLVYPGTYEEDVTVDVENLTLIGVGGPGSTVLDASGYNFGFSVQADGVTIDNFAVMNANWEGIEVYGEDIEEGSVTIRNNVLENNPEGIFFGGDIYDSTITIENNLIQSCSAEGIDFYNEVDYIDYSRIVIENNRIINNPGTYAVDLDVYEIYSSEIVIVGNTIDNNGYDGIFWGPILDSHVLIENNSISNNDWGIYFYGDICGNSEVGIAGNTIDNNDEDGIYFYDDIYDNSTVLIENNSISNNNYDGIYFDDEVDFTGVVVNYNNIVNNVDYGACNDGVGDLDATLNWWGTVNPGQVYAMVDGPVEVFPWLDAPYPGGAPVVVTSQTVENSGTVNAENTAGTAVDYNCKSGQSTTVMVMKYPGVPENTGKPAFGSAGLYVDVYVPEPGALENITIRVYYEDADILALGLIESELRLYYWDNVVLAWRPCSLSGVNTAENYIWATLTENTKPPLSYLLGGPFGGGTAVNIDSPTTGAPVYVRPGNYVNVQFDVAADNAGSGDIEIRVFSGATVIGTRDITYDFASGANENLLYNVLILATAADGPYNLMVRARQPQGTGTWASDNENDAVIVDNTPPTVTITSTASDPTSTSPIPMTATFSENVTGFENGDITVGNGTAENFAGSDNVYTFNVTPAGQGAVTVDIAAGVAQDAAGNPNTAAAQFSITYDSVLPTVQIAVSDTLITDIDVGTDNFVVTLTYSEAMDNTVDPTITFINPATTTLENAVHVWSAGNTVDTVTYDVKDDGVEISDVDVKVSAAKDVAGNLQVDNTKSDAFSVDTKNPTVVSVTPSVSQITDANVGEDNLTLTIVYSENMDTSVNPTITFSPDVSDTLENVDNAWSDVKTFVATYDVKDSNVDYTGVDVTISGAKDNVGNTQVDNTTNDVFSIDTENPTVVSITVSDNLITDSDAGQKFTVTIQFNENMDNTVTPDVEFIPNVVGETLTFNVGWWSSDNRYYYENYMISDANVENFDVDIKVENAKDLAGNLQVSSTGNDKFDIDTKNPTITSMTVSDSFITDADVGGLLFTLDIYFSESMSHSPYPTVTYIPNVWGSDSTLKPVSGYWVNNTHHRRTYTIQDKNVNIIGVDIQVSNAYDAYGNLVISLQDNDKFDIDTKNPTVVSVTPNLTLITDANVGTDNFTLTIVYSEDMDTGVYPTITFTPAVGTTLENVDNNWTDDITFVATYDVADAGVNIVDVDVSSTGAKDENGNLQIDNTTNDVFSIDTENPTVVSVTPSDTLITDTDVGTPFTITVVYNENMNTSVYPTITFTPAVNTTLENVDNSWTDGVTFVATYDVADGGVNFVDVDVSSTGAKDENGNLQVDNTANDVFSIDTENPRVLSISVNDILITDSDESQKFTVTVQFDENMDNTVTPDVEFIPNVVGETLTFNVGWWSSNNLYYYENYTMNDANVENFDVDIKVENAKDLAGNLQVSFQDNNKFDIDTKNPTVVAITVSDNLITDSDVGQTFTLTIQFSERMKTSHIGMPSYIPNVTGETLSSGGSVWWGGDGIYLNENRTILDADVEHAGIDVFSAYNYDAAGNLQVPFQDNDKFDIDTKNPTGTVIVGTALICDGDLVQEVTVTYDETMDDASTPTITFTGAAGTFTPGAGAWNADDNVWTQSFTHDGTSEEVTGVTVGSSGATDLAGNVEGASVLGTFDIDTLNPSVTAIVPNLLLITDADVGVGTFIVTIDYDEPMDDASAPTVTFNPDVVTSGTLTLNAGLSDWTDADTYEAVYNVADVNETQLDVDINVAGATDVAGNTQNSGSSAGAFDVDTENPTAEIYVSDNLINDADEGLKLTITAIFSEAMDNSIYPDISFTPDVTADTLTYSENWWSADNTTYYENYTIADANVENEGVDVTVTGGKDLAGNDQVDNTGENMFDVDTLIVKIVFTTSAQTITAGEASDVMTIQTQNKHGNPSNVVTDMGINLSSTSATGVFSLDNVAWSDIGFVIIASGDNSASFYHKDNTAGTPTITVAESPSQDWTDDTQQQTINPAAISKIVFTTSAQTITAGEASDVMTIQTQDQYSNPSNVITDTTIALTSTSSTGKFDNSAAGPFDGTITSVTIAITENSTSFYYKDTTAGAPTITAAESPSQGWTDATQQQNIVLVAAPTYNITLKIGWNLISVPRELENSSVENVFSGITKVERVYGFWDNAWHYSFFDNGVWTHPLEIEDGKGYWVYATATTTLTLKLKAVDPLTTPPEYSLKQGWNLIGYTSLELAPSTFINDYLVSLSGIWTTLYRYDPIEGWEVAKLGAGFQNVDLGRGYWIYLTDNGVLVP